MPEVDQNLEQQIEFLEFGIKMRPIVNSPSWPDLVQFVNDYVEKIDKLYRRLEPGDPAVIGSQAALHALDEFAEKFETDLEQAVQFADRPPQDLMLELRKVRAASDVALSMGPTPYVNLS